MAIYLGIDGGGSKTSCLIGDETSVLGTGTGAASNVVRVGEAQARESLAGAIRQACTVAHLDPSEIGNVCVGLAGAARPEISELVRRIVSRTGSRQGRSGGRQCHRSPSRFRRWPGRDRDCRHRLDRLWPQPRRTDRARRRLGIRHLRRGLRPLDRPHRRGRRLGAWDENPEQDLRLIEMLMKSWRLQTIEQLVPAANATPPPDFAALFPAVLSLADSGDRIARDVLTQAEQYDG